MSKSRRRDTNGIIKIVNERDKIINSDLLQIKRTKVEGDAVARRKRNSGGIF